MKRSQCHSVVMKKRKQPNTIIPYLESAAPAHIFVTGGLDALHLTFRVILERLRVDLTFRASDTAVKRLNMFYKSAGRRNCCPNTVFPLASVYEPRVSPWDNFRSKPSPQLTFTNGLYHCKLC